MFIKSFNDCLLGIKFGFGWSEKFFCGVKYCGVGLVNVISIVFVVECLSGIIQFFLSFNQQCGYQVYCYAGVFFDVDGLYIFFFIILIGKVCFCKIIGSRQVFEYLVEIVFFLLVVVFVELFFILVISLIVMENFVQCFWIFVCWYF